MSFASESGIEIDWTKVACHLAQHGMTLDPACPPRRFAGGLANINMLVRIDGDWAVFRRPPDGPLPRGAHDMAREHRVLSRLWQVLPIAPKSLHYCGDPEIAGAPFQILAFHEGQVVRGDRLAPLPDTADTGAALADMLIATLARIHAVDATAAGLGDLGRPEGFLARSIGGWKARAGSVLGGRLSPGCAFVADWLECQRAADTLAPTLLHNDFKLDNIILDGGAITPVAVVDWDMASRGDPLFDLATLLSYWAEPDDPDAMRALGQMPTARPGFPSREEAARAYAARTGRSLQGFHVHRVLAIFKLAVVMHQLHARYAAEGSSDPRHRSFAATGDGLFGFAADVARGRRF